MKLANNKVSISETTGETIVNCSTNDGSTNGLVVKDSDGNIVEYTDSDGFHSVRYRDEYVGSPWLPAGGAAAPNVISAIIGGVAITTYTFNGTTTEERFANHFEIAHDIPLAKVNDGTLKLEVHVHFRPSDNNAGDVKWFFDWCYTPVDSSPIAMTTQSFIKTIEANQQHFQLLVATDLAIPAGGFGIGGIITFNIRRTPTDAEDTYAHDVLFIKCAMHVPTDGDGSRQVYVK